MQWLEWKKALTIIYGLFFFVVVYFVTVFDYDVAGKRHFFRTVALTAVSFIC